MDVFEGITALADYGVRTGLIEESDRTWAVNALLAALELDAYEERTVTGQPALTEILDSLLNYACANGLCQDSVVYRDLFDTKLMGLLTPRPSAVIRRFWDLYAESPKAATDDYYAFSKTTNYIRADRLAKDAKWITPTPYGDMDITINLSKPEKDPKAIAAALQMKQSATPSASCARRTRATPDGSITRHGKTTGSFPWKWAAAPGSCSIRPMATITSTVLCLMAGTRR